MNSKMIHQMEIKIERISTIAMLEQCAELFTAVFNNEPWNDEWTKETAIALFTCYYHTPKFMGWVVVVDNEPIACAVGSAEPHYTGKIFYLREMFVAAASQKMGIGGQLMNAIKTGLHRVGIQTVVLFTQKSIFDYYSKFGFKEIEEMGMMSYPLAN